MSKELRPYQKEVKQKIYDAWDEGAKNVLLVLPTGLGKSIVLCSIAIDLAIKATDKKPTAIAVHRKELVSQLCLTLADEGIPHNIIAPRNVILGIVAAQRTQFNKQFYDHKAVITVLSVDTLNARILKHEKWAKSIRFWITDEAAHVLKANKWGRALAYFQDAIGLGVTATPQRLDKRGLGSHVDGVFDVMVEGPNTKWGIDNNFLSKYKIVIPESDYRLHLKESTGDGDYSKEAMIVASQKSHIVGDVVENYLKFAKGTQAIVFASDIGAGERIEKQFQEVNISVKLLTGLTDDSVRLNSLRAYREKKIHVLVNVDLFDEGLDCLSNDTEILTPDGWKNSNNIVSGNDCYAWDAGKEQIETVPILRKVVRPTRPNEKMLSIVSQHTDIRITENHNIYWRAKDYYTSNFRAKDFSTSKAKEIFDYNKPFNLPISSEMKFKGIDLSDDEIMLLGWALTDGYLEDEGKYLSISQSKPRFVQKIKDIFSRLNWQYSVRRRPLETLTGYNATMDNYIFRLKVNPRWKEIRHLFSKNLHKDLHLMTKKQFKILWDSMMDGDGHKKPNKNGKLCTTRKLYADNLMHMACVRGYAIMYGNYLTDHGKIVYDLGLREKQYIQLTKRDSRGANFTLEESKGETVWCVTNTLGTLITRRNGKIAILGNCPGIECVIMARPTKSLGKMLQMTGRGLRPLEGKPHLILIDHVGNIKEHGLPCSKRKWTLDRGKKKKKNLNLIRICSNFMCNGVFDRILTVCPFCGQEVTKPVAGGGGRVGPEMVDGDLVMLDPETIREMEAKTRLEAPESVGRRVEMAAGVPAGVRAERNQRERIETQTLLAEKLALWAGKKRDENLTDRQIHKAFFLEFDETMSEALSKPKAEMISFMNILEDDIGNA